MTNFVPKDVPPILVVDDNSSNLLAMEATLEPLGYPIVQATSGIQALKRLDEQEVVLILMDVHMPGLDGYATTEQIRQRVRSEDVPIVFVTAIYDEPEHAHRGYALGAVDYITKPYDPEAVRGKVHALVALYMRGQHAERQRSEETERIKDLFLGAVGHDLRNPLNAIQLASQALARAKDSGNPNNRFYVQRIESASRRMDRMIEDILDLTRGQFAGGIPLSVRTTDARDVCRRVLDEHRLANPNRLVEFDLDGAVVGSWDADRLERVVSNLLANATHHGGGGPVQVHLRDMGDRAILTVHNGGAAIPPELLPTIFEAFRHGQRPSHGLGLGLYIVREIVHAHDGSIEVTSTPREGTTFTVTLPKFRPSSGAARDSRDA
jgi:signal transduction histidine kinase